MLTTYVQLAADYETSQRSTETVRRAHDFIYLFMNGSGIGHAILASSTTVLCAMLADCYARTALRDRNEIIVAETAHEANAGPWFRLAERGYRIHTWLIKSESLELDLDALVNLLSERTLIVAFPHVSNVGGRIEGVQPIAARVHDVGARVVVDGVAFAPHRAIDVASLVPSRGPTFPIEDTGQDRKSRQQKGKGAADQRCPRSFGRSNRSGSLV